MIRNYILVGVASAIVGAAVGATITKIVERKRYKKEIEAVNDTMAAVKSRKKVKVLEHTESESPVEEDGAEEPVNEDSEEASDEGGEYRDTMGPYRPSKEHPYLITEEDFNANDGRSKYSVFYYSGDNTAAFVNSDRAGEELDIENDLGASYGNLDDDRFFESEDGIIYIRNHKKSEDYAVDLYPGVSGTE